MTDEKLIEAAKRLLSDVNPKYRPALASLQADDIRMVASAVFEKAHAKELDASTEPVKNGADSLHVAPTDDEREALLDSVRDRPTITRMAHVTLVEKIEQLRDALRRPEVPEPSADEVDETAAIYQPCHFDESGMYAKTWCHTHGQDHITPDGDVWVNGFDLGDGQTYSGPISQEDLFAARSEPQGEPSDARWIDDVETLALAQTAGHARMLEIGEGIGGLGVRNRAMFEDMLAWQDSSGNDHADTVLRLIAALRAAGEAK